MEMKVSLYKYLIIVTDYPNNNGGKALYYVHNRNLEYHRVGLDITVLNFSASNNYVIDNINVITLNEYKKNIHAFNILISHAPNLRHHIKFILRYGNNFIKYFFFFHGHEVLRIQKVYPKPYEYIKGNCLKNFILDMYDILKLNILHYFFFFCRKKSHFIFVSNWMLNEFEKWIKLNRNELNNKFSIIYNSVSNVFENDKYDINKLKKYDFITIRSYMDESKYCIDIVNRIAKENIDKVFLIIGKGDYFKYNEKSPNIIWVNQVLSQEDIVNYLNESKVALMPTRTDAQGVMMCEMATFGIPVITSDISVCREVFEGFKNVSYIDNEEPKIKDLKFEFTQFINDKYYKQNTIYKEIKLLRNFINENI